VSPLAHRLALRSAAALCLWCVSFAALPADHPGQVLAATPLSRMDLPWWRQRFETKAAELRSGPVDLAFYGDSITQDWEHDGPQEWNRFRPVWEQFYGDRHAVNLGFQGDTTAHLLWRIEHGEADAISPRVAVVLIGANNLGRVHWGAEQSLAGIDADILALHRHLPRTHIVLLPILPSERSEWVTQTTAQINTELQRRYARSAYVTYVDVTGVFMTGGQLDRTKFLDRYLQPPDPLLHPTAQAQAQMASAIEPVIAGLLGDRNHATR
jgi:lysophospholipase L1-like esterase